jgi:hypothetical protein
MAVVVAGTEIMIPNHRLIEVAVVMIILHQDQAILIKYIFL